MTGHALVSELLQQIETGDPQAVDRLTILLYDELHDIAARLMKNERPDHTLRPTALVHEAYLRLVDQRSVEWTGRVQFLALAARMMRRVLVDHARRRGAAKRGAGRRVTLTGDIPLTEEPAIELLALDDALERLALLSERQARVVELRFFGGLEVKQTAKALRVSEATVERDWRVARAFLARTLEGA